MAKLPICATTHVKHDAFYLQKWIDHYSSIVGRENLFVHLDGNDWETDVDLSGITVEYIEGSPHRRIKNDRFIAGYMSGKANALRRKYQYVLRTDVDEYVIRSPKSEQDFVTALRKHSDRGYIYALGLDVVQRGSTEPELVRSEPILGQRRYAYVSDKYSKPFAIWRWNNWTGGAHRLINRPVEIDPEFYLVHLALSDQKLAYERHLTRGGPDGLHVSHLSHQQGRLSQISEAATRPLLEFEEAKSIGLRDFPFEEDGSPAKRCRNSKDPRGSFEGLYTTIPPELAGIV
ncbi:hypothetical protein [Roseovarius sp. EL26]|uniref:hypothetical protein n=1 Tax=Roseovarius sp. EL26 TaxID=2126672 RepID=UPI000EA2A2E3|nr:hypothetical protein [Roseovarius sp. EL26]